MRALTLSGDWDPRESVHLSEEELAGRWARDARQVWRNPRWTVEDRPRPEISARDDVVVQVRRSGIAGSNCRMGERDAEGYVTLPYTLRLPLVPGHEVAGEVVEIGPEVRGLKVGDLVSVEALRYCGKCRPCRHGRFNQCENGGFAGMTFDGGMAEYMVAPERHAYSLEAVRARVGADKALDIGSICEPAAIAYVGMFHAAGGFLPGANVAVFGCGPIGLSAIALARCAGAASVVAFDPQPARVALALQFGADSAFDSGAMRLAGAAPAHEVMAASNGLGADFLIEATGMGGEVFPEIEASLGLGAKVVTLGVERRAVPSNWFAYQRVGGAVFGTIGHIGGFEPVIALHAAGRIDLTPMIARRYPLQDGLEAIAHAARRYDAKILIQPDATTLATRVEIV